MAHTTEYVFLMLDVLLITRNDKDKKNCDLYIIQSVSLLYAVLCYGQGKFRGFK